MEAVNDDLFVSPDGDNNNSGLTPEQPLKNICFALTKIISDSTHPNTIHLANGVYSTFTTNEKFPLNLRSYVSFSGQSRDSTILDANGIIFLLQGNKLTERYSIKSLTLQHGDGNKNTSLCIGTGAIINNYNAVFEDVKVTECMGTVVSGLHINTPNNILLKDMVFNNNRGGAALRIGLGLDPGLPPLPDTAWLINSHVNSNIPDYDTTDTAFGGGMSILGLLGYSSYLTCFIMNSEFVENINNAPPYGKSGCSLAVTFASEAYAINCTFGNNTTSNPMGAGIGITYNSTLNIYNSILYGNFPAELYLASDPDQICSLNIYHSLIAGGEE